MENDYAARARAQALRLREAGHALILAVESSCDETAVAVVRDGREVLSNAIASQIDTHALYGGVVPEIASRMHVEAIDPLLDHALAEAGVALSDIDAVAVTYGPGLVGALLTGVSWAKALAYAMDRPIVPVNHIEGHVSANYIAHPDLEPPFVCLVASGGHSHILNVTHYGEYTLLGQTTDDAAGEAFDKVARVLDISYPGGPLLDKLADTGNDTAYKFPHPHTQGKYDFSFSGLKTAVINQAHNLRQQGIAIDAKNFAASFRRSVVDMLVDKTVAACKDTGARRVAVAGGVAANSLLRSELKRRGEKAGLEVYIPPKGLCTDNAAMIGSAGFYTLMAGGVAGLDLNAVPALRVLMSNDNISQQG
ncbi:MAG: tRNA (adenosine(37)-N6)-threonylcarbamoyltransferase complex transferase subunit TsaD [Clostridia bacterium]|nr:tRNA (adenosine(37)-N6)-threonylcarbamoyltransferase complex transferase subunit TsaD [Clostridia bacterium]